MTCRRVLIFVILVILLSLPVRAMDRASRSLKIGSSSEGMAAASRVLKAAVPT